MKKMFFGSLFISLLSFHSKADNSVGCGLGSLIAPQNSLISVTTRSITNASLSNQLFGVTSGTSGCARHTIVMKNQAASEYAIANLDHLKNDIAIGKGEYLETFAYTLGCSNKGADLLGKNLKQNFNHVFKTAHTNSDEVLLNIHQQMVQENTLQQECTSALI